MSNSFDTLSEVDEEYQEICLCMDGGWIQTQSNWVTCEDHYNGQLHPESVVLLLDEPLKLKEEERLSQLRWKISKSQEQINRLTINLRLEYAKLRQLEIELSNKSPTVKVQLDESLLKKDTE